MRSPVKRFSAIVDLHASRAAAAMVKAKRSDVVQRERLDDAVRSREAVAAVAVSAVMAEEVALTRGAFFDRLRAVAIARAHVAESMLQIAALENEAHAAGEQAAEARTRAAAARRRQSALCRWLDERRREERRRRQRRTERQIQEDYVCQ